MRACRRRAAVTPSRSPYAGGEHPPAGAMTIRSVMRVRTLPSNIGWVCMPASSVIALFLSVPIFWFVSRIYG
jgi:hypothetical protein